MTLLFYILCSGIIATALMDLWGIVRKALLGMAPPDYGMVGRWLAHMPHGQFRHSAISKATPVKTEKLMGWAAHYLIGILFAVIPLLVWGSNWFLMPVLWQAVAVGLLTVAAPFFIMQPGMGAGIAASRTPKPNTARLHSIINHAVFGLGLYLGARLCAGLASQLF